MKNNVFGEYRLSQLMLGTVQFGLEYGIANTKGQPSDLDVREILACAYEGGVNCLDTAAAYGRSEDVIGRALVDLDLVDRMIVVTKVPAIPEGCSSSASVKRFIKDNVIRSLSRLRIDVLPVCLFHYESDSRYLDILNEIKEDGLIRHIGVSCGNSPDHALSLLQRSIEALQIPTNILDPRHVRSGAFASAQRKGVAVFARSVYLQGLILMPDHNVPEYLQSVIPVKRKLEALAAESGFGLAEMVVRYVLSIEGVTCVITGVESVEQMRENIGLFSKGPLDKEMMKSIADCVPALPEEIITPSMWNNNRVYHQQASRR